MYPCVCVLLHLVIIALLHLPSSPPLAHHDKQTFVYEALLRPALLLLSSPLPCVSSASPACASCVLRPAHALRLLRVRACVGAGGGVIDHRRKKVSTALLPFNLLCVLVIQFSPHVSLPLSSFSPLTSPSVSLQSPFSPSSHSIHLSR